MESLRPKLTPNTRLIAYSYLNVSEILQTIASLSTTERNLAPSVHYHL